jgi:succinoglycan biosynthesis transport protein ExoP
MSSPQNNFVPISRRPPDIEDYIDMIRRYRSWIIGPMFLGFVISAVIAFYWDDTYLSHATMKLTPQVVSQTLVQNNASTQLYERLTQITTTILSHSNLIGIITDPAFNLYPKDRAKGKALEDVANDMSKDIKYQLTGVPLELGNNRVASAFQISFSYTDRKKVKMVVDKLVSMYEERNSEQQRTEAKTTSTFVTEQFKQAQQKLQAAEDALARFTMENRGHMPNELQSNWTELSSLNMRLASSNDALNTATTARMGLERRLSELAADEKAANSNLVTRKEQAQSGDSIRVQQLRKTIDDLSFRLAGLKKNYRDDMPEVSQLQTSIDFAQSELDKAEKDDAEKAAQHQQGPIEFSNPAIAQQLDKIHSEQRTVSTQIEQENATIRLKQGQVDQLQKDIVQVRHAIDAGGISSPEYNRLMHERDIAETNLQTESKRQQGADQQVSLEAQQDGEKLEALDLANIPDSPTEPKREVWTTVGTVLGLLLGLVLAGAKEVKNTSLKNLKDVRAYTNLPVLSSIPLLENALLVRRKRRLFWLVWTSVFIIGLVCISASMYYHFVLRAT